MYSGIEKGTSRAEVTSNSEKIKPVALTIVELRESEGIRQLVTACRVSKKVLRSLFEQAAVLPSPAPIEFLIPVSGVILNCFSFNM